MRMWFLFPNGLTATRIAAGPLLPLAYVQGWNPLWFAGVNYLTGLAVAAALAALTDLLDGRLARWLRCENAISRHFDPVADGIFCTGVASTVLIHVGITPYAVLYWLPIAGAAWYIAQVGLMRWRGEIAETNRWAKWGAASGMLSGGLLLGHIALGYGWLEVLGLLAAFVGLEFERCSFHQYRCSRPERRAVPTLARPV